MPEGDLANPYTHVLRTAHLPAAFNADAAVFESDILPRRFRYSGYFSFRMASSNSMDFMDRLKLYRPLFWDTVVIGLFVVNGLFLYYTLVRPEVIIDALKNPV